MVTITMMLLSQGWDVKVSCLSDDAKPTECTPPGVFPEKTMPIPNGAKLIEIDTGARFLFDEESSEWALQPETDEEFAQDVVALKADMQEVEGEVGDLKSAINKLTPAATTQDVGKALIVKTVDPTTGKPSEYEYGEAGGGAGGAVNDVQINGTSIVTDGVANVPIANDEAFGAVKVRNTSSYGVKINNLGFLDLQSPTNNQIKEGRANYIAIVPGFQHESAFYGLAKAAGADMSSIASTTVGQYPEAQKSAISEMLNGSVAVSGTTPTINALPGVRYVCGEVSTLDITLPASGIVDVVFTSGSTATVLTITPPSGVTLKWANGFDPTALEANTTYEINIMDGLGVAASWT